MYECQECGLYFELADKLKCPNCESTNICKVKYAHCQCCGARLPAGKLEYCSDSCRKRGNKLFKCETMRKKQLIKDPLVVLVKQVENYNRRHGTKYSYGQFVAFKLEMEKNKNDN